MVGIDLVEVSRFSNMMQQDSFLQKVFSQQEREYCFSFKNAKEHLAGIYAAKEAVSKALGVMKYPFAEIEIYHSQNGAPYAKHKGKKLAISISISHTKTVAAAIAVK